MRAVVVVNAAKQILERLKPDEFDRKGAEYRRGGLPGQSMAEGSPSANHALPVGEIVTKRDATGTPIAWRTVTKDAWDRTLKKRVKAYHGHLRRALLELEAAERVQNSLLLVHAPVPEEEPTKCATMGCVNVLDPGFTKGHCSTHRAKRYQEARQDAIG